MPQPVISFLSLLQLSLILLLLLQLSSIYFLPLFAASFLLFDHEGLPLRLCMLI
jgi:hypothetical protein